MICFLTMLVLTAPLSAVPAAAAAPKAPQIAAGAAILMDWETGEVLFQRNAHQRRDPASTTKVLTALIALERGDLDAKVKVSRKAAYTVGSSMYIKPGEVYSLHDLLYGLLMRSGNDAAVAIAEHLAGSVEEFATWMNARAKAAGARNSHFVNPHGLTVANHYSTAYDLAMITREAMRDPRFRSIVAEKAEALTYEDLNREVILYNTNRLLHEVDGADGVKTGTTAAAGPCLIASATRQDQKLISVVLRAGNRWRESARILEWGFEHFRLARFGRKDEVIMHAAVDGGILESLPLVLDRDLSAVVAKGEAALPDLQIDLPPVVAPVKAGQPVGTVRLKSPGGVEMEATLLAAHDMQKATFFDLMYRKARPYFRWLRG